MSQGVGTQQCGPEVAIVSREADGPASMAVVKAMADAREASPLSLPPLADAVDPEALDALCAEGGATSRVTFDFAGHRVRVAADETVTVTVDRPQGPA